MNNLSIITTIIILAGCSSQQTIRFNGEGTFQELIEARYECLQETQQEGASGIANAYGANVDSRVMPACGAFATCLATKGFYRADDGHLVIPPELNVQCR